MATEPKDAPDTLRGMRVGFLVAAGFEEEEVVEPRRALDAEGAETQLLAPEAARLRSWRRRDWGAEFSADESLEQARSDSFDALVLPGGVLSSDHLRSDEHARVLVRHWMDNNMPLAAMCHGPWLLVDTETARGRRLTSHPGIANDLKNAGAEWFDAEVVVDGNLVTSRGPHDLSALIDKMLVTFARAAEARNASAR